MRKQARILVLGTGFIGSHLAERLKNEGFEVSTLSRQTAGDLGALVPDAPVFQTHYDLIFHLMSTTTPGTSERALQFDVSSNLLGTISFLEKIKNPEKTKVIFISSAGTVYGPLPGPATEASPTNPSCSYGITKLAIEKYLALFKKRLGLDHLILRVSNAYGPWDPSRRPFGIINHLVDQVVNKRPLSIYGATDTTRDFIYIDDLVEAIRIAGLSEVSNQVFNLSYGESHSIADILSSLESAFGFKPEIVTSPAREFDLRDVRIDSSLFKRTFNWQPEIPLFEGVKRTVEFRKAHGHRR